MSGCSFLRGCLTLVLSPEEKGLESRLRLGALSCQEKDGAGMPHLRAQGWEGRFWLPYFRKCLEQLENGARIHWW